jgi:hypothetical protein
VRFPRTGVPVKTERFDERGGDLPPTVAIDDGDGVRRVLFPTAKDGFKPRHSTSKLVGRTDDGLPVVGVDAGGLVGRL